MLSKILNFFHTFLANLLCFIFLDPWWCILLVTISPLCFITCAIIDYAPSSVEGLIQYLVGNPIRMIYISMKYIDSIIRKFVFWNLQVKESFTHKYFFIPKRSNPESRPIVEISVNSTDLSTLGRPINEISISENPQNISPVEVVQEINNNEVDEAMNSNFEPIRFNFDDYGDTIVNSEAEPTNLSNFETITSNSEIIHEASYFLNPLFIPRVESTTADTSNTYAETIRTNHFQLTPTIPENSSPPNPVSVVSAIPSIPPSPSQSESILGCPPFYLRPSKNPYSRKRRNQIQVSPLPLNPLRNQATTSFSNGVFTSTVPCLTASSSLTKAVESARKAAQEALNGLSRNKRRNKQKNWMNNKKKRLYLKDLTPFFKPFDE